nr:MAG TPA: hypothetical protein [Caudoviricetes sp.]
MTLDAMEATLGLVCFLFKYFSPPFNHQIMMIL